jgi:hypothetical protein
MKLNFWQWLGLILLIAGVALYLYEHRNTGTSPSVTPATQAP